MRIARALLASLALAAAGGAAARFEPPAPGAVSPRVIARNWRRHPALAAIRDLVRGHQLAMLSRRWPADPARRCLSAERPLAAEVTTYRDEHERIRVLVESTGTDGSVYRLEQHYDQAGSLRFAFARSEAADGSLV
jgi:hypothetical protein